MKLVVPKRVIYLDIDGVLNTFRTKETSPSGYIGILQSKIQILKQILDETCADIILSSTWRTGWNPTYSECDAEGKYLTDNLALFGIIITDKLNGFPTRKRGNEILQHVSKNNICSWIVIDDEKFEDFSTCGISDCGDVPRWIRTGSRGLEVKHIQKAKKLFEAQEIKQHKGA